MAKSQTDSINSPDEFSDNNRLHMESQPTSPEVEDQRSATPSSIVSTAATSINEFQKKPPSSNSLNLMNSTNANITGIDVDLDLAVTNSITVKDEKLTQPSKKKEKKEKKEKSKPINFANGISTSVPLTGERPKPTGDKPSMDDDVLLAIFIILFENDVNSEGMTVKQICDILVEKHPEMSKISSKTSNLVSAKLNAYVKKVEKGEKSIHYSLSRDWADSSPKRMVYVYRGILAPEYPEYVRRVIEKHRLLELTKKTSSPNLSEGSNSNSNNESSQVIDNLESSNSPSVGVSPSGLHLKQESPFGDSLDFRIPQLSVPYSVAPVTASLNRDYGFNKYDFNSLKGHQYLTVVRNHDYDDADDNEDGDSENNSDSALRPGFDDDDDNENDDDDDLDDVDTGIYKNHGYSRRGSEIVTEKIPSGIGKRSKSMSFIHKRPKTTHLTTAAATPRIPRKKSIVNSATAANAVAALRAAALNTFNSSMNDSVNSITTSIMSDTSVEPSISVRWLETVRSGFFNQDIESPENVSLAELETMFT